MIAFRASALALAAVLATSAAARAQTPPPPPRQALGTSTWAPGSQLRHEMREVARVRALHDVLNIRPDQEQAFQAFAASMKPGERGEKSEQTERAPQDMAGTTTPERVDAMGRMMDERMNKMRERFQRHATAVKALYAVLSPEQRRTLDALPELTGHGMGMGSHGHMDHPDMGMDHPDAHE